MKVFLSWSGRLVSPLPACRAVDEVYCAGDSALNSTSGIDRCSVCFSKIGEQLNSASVGIICPTRENKNKPWILFEAGALAKGLVDSKVCAFLINLQPQHLESPLSQFNHTLPDRDGLFSLAVTLNSNMSSPMSVDVSEKVFNSHWN
jgi:hypothetical protein